MARVSIFLGEKMALAGLIKLHSDCVCGSWYSGLAMNLEHRFQTLQNRAIRIILNLLMRIHLDSTRFGTEWLKVQDRVSQLCY